MLELNPLDKFKHKETGEIVVYLCRDYEDDTKVVLYDEYSQTGKIMSISKFTRLFYNITEPEYDREV